MTPMDGDPPGLPAVDPRRKNPQSDLGEELSALRWHLDRYDRLRASTATRASVVTSASALLSAGNAVIIAQLLGGTADMPSVLRVLFAVGALASGLLVVLSLLAAVGVLATPRASRSTFGEAHLPTSFLYNGTDTVASIKNFGEFSAAFVSQSRPDDVLAAQVELWINIKQHRARYEQLRRAVQLLRLAAVMFFMLLTGVVTVGVWPW
ncbi:hypothetical protein ACQP2Y_15045 [Actinoplanes sp. CA-051413]|uniref:hypothetical protein n=1 Tax=Actinoplanes sp. CA-051413 TaxID=3239899 RepID=UPI003D95978C